MAGPAALGCTSSTSYAAGRHGRARARARTIEAAAVSSRHAPPSAIAPIANSGWMGAPILRTTKTWAARRRGWGGDSRRLGWGWGGGGGRRLGWGWARR
jgi:hypothetical protein